MVCSVSVVTPRWLHRRETPTAVRNAARTGTHSRPMVYKPNPIKYTILCSTPNSLLPTLATAKTTCLLSRPAERTGNGPGTKEEDIGVWTADGATGNYGHAVWAHKVMRLALGMGDITGFLIEPALENIPNMLKDHVLCSYS